jgi:hypothetical protein
VYQAKPQGKRRNPGTMMNGEEQWKEEMKQESKCLTIVRELIQRSIN